MVDTIRPKFHDDPPKGRWARLSFRPARGEAEHLITHYFSSAEEAMEAVLAAELLDFGVRLRNEQSEIGEDSLTFSWLVEIWSEACWADEEDDADVEV